MYILEFNLVLFFLLFDFHKNIMVFYFTNWTKDLYDGAYFYQASVKTILAAKFWLEHI